MDYEQKYKEALSWMQSLHEGLHGATKKEAEHYFPELKESDDEKIRKELIGFLRNIPNSNYTCEEMALWLEKQGVQPRYNIGDVICDKSCTTLNKEAQPNMEIVDINNGMYICDKGSFPVSQQDEYELVSKKIDTKLNDDSVSNELREASTKHAEKELKNQTFHDNLEFELVYTFEEGAKWNAAQKSAWSEEDEGILDEIIDFFENGTVKLQHDLSLYASWLKSLKNRVQPQLKQEWSEEDKKIIDRIESEFLALHRGDYKNIDFNDVSSLTVLNWVRKIKSLRFQNTWKPSDEQMIALNDVITNGHLSNANERILKGLQEQLKKLK